MLKIKKQRQREELGLPVTPTLGTVISLALIVTTGRIITGTGRVVSRASTGAHTTANTTEGVSTEVIHSLLHSHCRSKYRGTPLLTKKGGWDRQKLFLLHRNPCPKKSVSSKEIKIQRKHGQWMLEALCPKQNLISVKKETSFLKTSKVLSHW